MGIPSGWFSDRSGHHIPIFDGQSKADAIKNYYNSKHGKDVAKLVSKKSSKSNSSAKNIQEGKKVREAIKEISSSKYDEGTYDLVTKKPVEFTSGYQATFQRTGDKYSDEEFGELVNTYKQQTDGKAYIGKFQGSPEVSFHFKTEQEAIDICKKYNQVSYWDWKNMNEIKNPDYKEGSGNDYE